MREVIPFLGLMKETAGLFGLLSRDPVFRCTVWEYNESCIIVAKRPKFTPRKNHIAITNKSSEMMLLDGNVIFPGSKFWALRNCDAAFIVFPTVQQNTGCLVNSPNNPAVSFIRPKNGITSRIALDREM